MPHQSTKVTPFSPAPLREYAREAVAAARCDQRHGVLAWRIASHLVGQVRTLTGRPSAELSQVPPAEREFYIGLAQAAIALMESIDGEAPPTATEILRYEQRKALALARAKARADARRFGHEMDVWRPSDPGYELSTCRRCGAGVTLHLESAGISAARQLELPCQIAR
ncbi:MAG TPA: hypothetical protein VM364_00790 [Vicinamibacterales bacterium]|nr:hypothetical protein [Vicinamibacterales bacterium]